jgi:hypothetical protein
MHAGITQLWITGGEKREAILCPLFCSGQNLSLIYKHIVLPCLSSMCKIGGRTEILPPLLLLVLFLPHTHSETPPLISLAYLNRFSTLYSLGNTNSDFFSISTK